MKRTIDARGLACPQPVVLTLKAITESDEVTTIVDNEAALENVSRLARSKGCSVEVSGNEGNIHITIKRDETSGLGDDEEAVPFCRSATPSPAGPLVLFVPSDCFGRGPTELGEKLMGAFFHSVSEVEPKPDRIIFMNSGVKLVVEGSRTLQDIRSLEARGIEVYACGTCLGYFELTDKLAVGSVSNMYDIATSLLEAEKIVSL